LKNIPNCPQSICTKPKIAKKSEENPGKTRTPRQFLCSSLDYLPVRFAVALEINFGFYCFTRVSLVGISIGGRDISRIDTDIQKAFFGEKWMWCQRKS
jgi:hypothetical protein